MTKPTPTADAVRLTSRGPAFEYGGSAFSENDVGEAIGPLIGWEISQRSTPVLVGAIKRITT